MRKETIDYCRRYYELPDNISDHEIQQHCTGSLGHAMGDLRWAVDNLKSAIKAALPGWLKRAMNID